MTLLTQFFFLGKNSTCLTLRLCSCQEMTQLTEFIFVLVNEFLWCFADGPDKDKLYGER